MAAQGPSNEQDDADLGIGEQDGGDLSTLMENPAFASQIDAMIARRIGAMVNAPAASLPPGIGPQMEAFMELMERAINTRDEQRPGYAKPLTADQKTARERGKAKMFALLDHARKINDWPQYLIGGDGPGSGWHGPSSVGPIHYKAGQKVNWRGGPPAECFIPLNHTAAEIYVAYKQWLGEETDVETLLSYANAVLAGGTQIPPTAFVTKGASDVQAVNEAALDMSPKRIMGAGIDPRATHPALRPPGVGGAEAPLGPTFVEAA
jgi:hypothetical protein